MDHFKPQLWLRNDGGNGVGKTDRDHVTRNAMPVLCFHPDTIYLDNPVAPRPRSFRLGQAKDVAQDRPNSPNRMIAVGSHQWNRAPQMPNSINGCPYSRSPARTGPVAFDHFFMITRRRPLSPMWFERIDRLRMHYYVAFPLSHVMIYNFTVLFDQIQVPKYECDHHEPTCT